MANRRLLLFTAVLFGGFATITIPAEPKSPDEVAVLIARLGDRAYDEREKAMAALIAKGEAVIPALQRAARETRNPEIRWRANRAGYRILRDAATSRTTGMEFAVIPPGEFRMGAGTRESGRRLDERQHAVKLTSRFLIGTREVTQAEYKAVTGGTPSHFAATGGGRAKVAGQTTDAFPVESMTWFDAVAFCNALSRKDGYKQYYALADVKRTNGAITSATVTRTGGHGYRLPTEAEWEYACRAGTTTAFHFGPSSRGGEGNFKTIIFGGYGGDTERPSKGRTTSGGEYKANAWGLSDVHGNVAEWCDDWYDAAYDDRNQAEPQVDPQGPKTGRHKVARGGSWFVAHTSCRSASRHPLTPDEAKDYIGFRIARTP